MADMEPALHGIKIDPAPALREPGKEMPEMMIKQQKVVSWSHVMCDSLPFTSSQSYPS
jgi:hypothetical protein